MRIGCKLIIVADYCNHGFKSGEIVTLLSLDGFNEPNEVIDSSGLKMFVTSKCVTRYDETIDNINAELQDSFDPNRYASLTEFNRISTYEGGGYRA